MRVLTRLARANNKYVTLPEDPHEVATQTKNMDSEHSSAVGISKCSVGTCESWYCRQCCHLSMAHFALQRRNNNFLWAEAKHIFLVVWVLRKQDMKASLEAAGKLPGAIFHPSLGCNRMMLPCWGDDIGGCASN